MFQSFSALILVVALFTTRVFSADICVYSARSCTGSFGCCSNIPEGTCCYWSSPYGWSVRYSGMPLTPWWLGKAFGDQVCSTQTSGVGSSGGSACASVFNGPTYTNWLSANWDSDIRFRRRDVGAAKGDCVAPDVLGYTTEDGKTRVIKVPEGQFDRLSGLAAVGAYDELASLEDVKE